MNDIVQGVKNEMPFTVPMHVGKRACKGLALLCGLLCVCVVSATAQPQSKANTAEPFVLIEFFTSEACVRCRESSALAAEVVQSGGGTNARAYLVSYHIDYLNTVEVRDPYSSESHSERQREYMLKLRRGAAVPGSFILNGVRFVDTNSPVVLQRAILSSVNRRPPARISLAQKALADANALRIAYEVRGLGGIRRPFFTLHFVVVEPKIERSIASGPNAGQRFTHVNSVRNFQSLRIDATGEPLIRGDIDVVLPLDLRREDAEILAVVQDPRTLEILGVKMLEPSVPKEKPLK